MGRVPRGQWATLLAPYLTGAPQAAGRTYQPAVWPRVLAQGLKDACCRWLQPEQHTKDELIDLIVLEQFLHVLPSSPCAPPPGRKGIGVVLG
uniref:SCAN box domain-containing protein n=1 Tax=Pelusios castaneus TaxID=367368 RepID=A0A8C8VGE0_9SAUR